MKSYFTTEEVYDERPDETPKPDTSLIFSFHSMTKEGILAALPNRPVVDCLVSRYFNSDSPSLREITMLVVYVVELTRNQILFTSLLFRVK